MFGDHVRVRLSRLSISISLAYVLAVAVVTTIASVVSPAAGQFCGWLLTLGVGTLVLGFLYYLVLPLLAASGFPGDGPPGLAVMVSGYVVAAAVNVVLVVGLATLCRELRDGRRRARARPATTSK
jgi:hypothetical protein